VKQERLCIPVYVCTSGINSVMDTDIILTESGNNKSPLAYVSAGMMYMHAG